MGTIETQVFENIMTVGIPVMGLDLSLTSTGAAVLTNDALIVKRFQPRELRGLDRLKWLMDMAVNLAATTQAQVCLIEGYAMAARQSHAHSLGELGGVVKLGMAMQGVPLAVAAPGCWKKAVTGKGNAKKPEIVLELYKRYGLELPQDDMADAACLAITAAMMTGRVPNLTKDQQASLKKIEHVPPLPIPKVRHRARPEEGEVLRTKPEHAA